MKSKRTFSVIADSSPDNDNHPIVCSKRLKPDNYNNKSSNLLSPIITESHEILQCHLFPFLDKPSLMSFILTCKCHCDIFERYVMRRSLNNVRLYYLNAEIVPRNDDHGEEDGRENQGKSVAMLGNILIPLLKNNDRVGAPDGGGEVMDHPYLRGLKNVPNADKVISANRSAPTLRSIRECNEWLQEVSSMEPKKFEQLLLGAITTNSASDGDEEDDGGGHGGDDKERNDVTSVASLLLSILFEWNRNNPERQQFFVAGGSVASVMFKDRWEETDVDIFVMENGGTPLESHSILRNLLLRFHEATVQHHLEYAVVKNRGTLNIVDKKERNAKIQFILRRVTNIENLMSFFDLDCCRFAFDGQQLYTIREGLRSLYLRCNLVPAEHIENGMYLMRAIKYGLRSIETYFYTLNPLPTEYYRLLDELSLFTVAKSHDKLRYSQCAEGNNSDDAGLYSPILPVIKWTSIREICEAGLQAFIKTELERPFETGYFAEECWSAFEKVNKKDPHMFAMSVVEVYERGDDDDPRSESNFFQDGYLDSHLRKKYCIFRCHKCRRCEFKPGYSPPEENDDDDEDDDDNEDLGDGDGDDKTEKGEESIRYTCESCAAAASTVAHQQEAEEEEEDPSEE